MLIENVELFKSWLSKKLTPICDADPAALAKYIVALIKKDKPESSLRETCTDQLDVFLQDKTKEFISELFETLKNKAYLPNPPQPPPPQAATPTLPISQTTTSSQSATNEAIANNVSSGPNNIENTQNKLETKDPPPRKSSSEKLGESTINSRRRSRSPLRDRDDRRRRYDDRRRDDRDRDRRDDRRDLDKRLGPRYGRSDLRSEIEYRRQRRSPPPRRSRSRTRSRSRDRIRRSPLRRSRSPGLKPRSRTRSHSRSRSRTRSRSPFRPRSLSRSPFRGRRSRSRSPDSRGSTPIQDHGDKDYRYGVDISSQPPSLSSIVNVPAHSENYRPRPPPRPRCRDFDEKGFCMRGDLCPYDHGLDPVVVDDVSLGGVLAFPRGGPPPVGPRGPVGPGPRGPLGPRGPGQFMQGPPGPMHRPSGPPMRGRPPHPGHRPPLPGQRPPPPPGTQGGYPPSNHPPPPGTMPPRVPPHERLGYNPRPEAFQPEPYNPEAPDVSRYNKFQEMGEQNRESDDAILQYQPQSRSSLVSVPTIPNEKGDNESNGTTNRTVVMSGMKRSYRGGHGGPPAKRGGHVYNRLGPRREPINYENTTLELRKIPPELNTIAKLNEHFSKFGNMVNLQVKHEGDPGAALIAFSTNAEAAAAYYSSEPVFNNRFIKVFWHNKEKQNEGANNNNSNVQDVQTEKRASVKERLGTIPPVHKLSLNKIKKTVDNNSKQVVLSPTGGLTKTVFNPSALKMNSNITSQLASQRATVVQKKKLLQKEAMKKKLAIQKQKHTLLQKQIEQQKVLFGKLESNKNIKVADKTTIIKTIKVLSESIEKLRKELTTTTVNMAPKVKPTPVKAELPATPKPVSKQQAQKEILDTELDIIAKQNEGADTSELRKRVAELKREAAALGLLGPGAGRGRGMSPRGRGRGRGRGGMISQKANVVDHRPKSLLIAGFSLEEKEEVLQHFMSYGEVVNNTQDDTIPSIILEFRTRHGAEQAVIGGQHFGTKSLVMSWHHPPSAVDEEENQKVAEESVPKEDETGAGVANEEEGDELDDLNLDDEGEVSVVIDGLGEEAEEVDEEVDEDVLLGLDEEEEEEEDDSGEDKSWRR